MLKRISTSQLRVGMYVSQLVGPWLDHPFWKKAFLLTDARQLAKLRGSPVREVWIDTSLGLDVEVPEAAIDESALETMIATRLAGGGGAESDESCSLEEELERAALIVASARGAMQAMFDDARLGRAVDAAECLPLVEEITASVHRNSGAIVSLARLKSSDDYTYMHSVAVCALMVTLARTLNFPPERIREAGLAGLVHDIGKAHMPPEILGKPGALTSEEFGVMRGHPQAGYDMLKAARDVGDSALDVCLHHHEKMNGKGYPFGLPRARISLMARMGAVCDVYDAITSNRAYKTAWDPSISIQRMAQWSREGHFDEAVLQAFVKSLGIYPIGSLLKLESGRLAVVMDQTPGHLLKPIVKTILSVATREPCASEIVDLSAPGCRDKVSSRESPDDWNLVSTDEYWRTPAVAPLD